MWLVGIGDTLTSIFACCVTFSTIGFMAYELDMNIGDFDLKGRLQSIALFVSVVSECSGNVRFLGFFDILPLLASIRFQIDTQWVCNLF